jgi:hypothetical protein
MRSWCCFLAVLLWSCTLNAQPGGSTRRANITGGGGSGKCTIEVEVDGTAEVEVSGDTARLRTLYGQPANWRRFQCNEPMPRNPVDFRFRGIDGRGRVELIRDPRDGGRAVVRIEDRKGGREGYTFDLEWRGGGGGGGGWGPERPGAGRFPAERAIRICQDGVVDRLNRDGYRDVQFERTYPDDNPGRDDWVLGTASARRDRRGERFSFSCFVDFRSGRVRSVDVRRR